MGTEGRGEGGGGEGRGRSEGDRAVCVWRVSGMSKCCSFPDTASRCGSRECTRAASFWKVGGPCHPQSPAFPWHYAVVPQL